MNDVEIKVLQLFLTTGLGPKGLNKIFDRIAIEKIPISSIFEMKPDDIEYKYDLKKGLGDAIFEAERKAEDLYHQLIDKRIQILARPLDNYPERLNRLLGASAPPLLFVKGDVQLLDMPSVGFGGSRKASEKGLEITRNISRELVKNGICVTSGYAKGVDLAAHRAALESEGATIFVLAEGIFRFTTKSEIKDILDDGSYLILSEFAPYFAWNVKNAMQRNSTVIGLTDAMLLIESGVDGGTFAAGEETLKLGKPLFTIKYKNPPESAMGNAYFLNKGASPILEESDSFVDISKLLDSAKKQQQMIVPKQEPVLNFESEPEPMKKPVDHKEPEAVIQENKKDSVIGYPKRLIEVDLPIKRISAHARREKSIRHGHISTLHIWWARRPLAACRAVICAALWPDPVDVTEEDARQARARGEDAQVNTCPPAFRKKARELMLAWVKEHADLISSESHPRAVKIQNDPKLIEDDLELRKVLLDFIADFANWDSSTVPEYLKTARALTQSAHEALGGAPGTRPLVVDPFAGGGSIPLEALRVGADAFASDLNPVAVMLNKVVLQYIPKYGQRLADEVRKWGEWVKKEAEKELSEFYPKDPDGSVPIAYLWARTIRCEGPGCGAEVPLMRSLWLAKKGSKSVALRIIPDQKKKKVDFEIIEKAKAKDVADGTVKRGSGTCPVCGYTTPVSSVREQLKKRHGGAADARLFAVVTIKPSEQGRHYRLPADHDLVAVKKATEELDKRKKEYTGALSLIPDELVNPLPHSVNRLPMYGMITWGKAFTSRQALALTTLSGFVRLAGEKTKCLSIEDDGFSTALLSCLSLTITRHADINASLSTWHVTRELTNHVFARQALPIVWDFCEANPFCNASGSFAGGTDWIARVLENIHSGNGEAYKSSATNHPLPDDSAHGFVTDPPYYDMISYADLSDFFYVWLKRVIGEIHKELFSTEIVQKQEECIVEPTEVEGVGKKDREFYLRTMQKAMSEGRRVLCPSGIGIVVFAHKSTGGWESQLKAMLDAGWVITGSWPIDTEMATKVAAIGQARLMSSIHLVCRPRENPDGSVRTDDVGDWRDVLAELPKRIHEWMPRLAEEGVVGADAIFSCLGPALEVFSRYSRVEKASGEVVTLKEYLEYVWAAVSREALGMIFSGADATGFEEDARITAMWLWTLSTGNGNGGSKADHVTSVDDEAEGAEDEGDEDQKAKKSAAKLTGYVMEYDAARKIAQGLGVHLEQLPTVVEVKGDKARLLPVAERMNYLFGKKPEYATQKKKKKAQQQKLFEELVEEQEERVAVAEGMERPDMAGKTTLDRVHQSMLLFAGGRGDALKRFLVDEGVGTDVRFWRLADALTALYPTGTDERRWSEGIMARKKGLGF